MAKAKKIVVEETIGQVADGAAIAQETIESDILNIKVTESEEEVAEEVVERINTKYTAEDGQEYEITVPKFRFKGNEYISAEAVEQYSDLLEDLLKVGSFIFKKI